MNITPTISMDEYRQLMAGGMKTGAKPKRQAPEEDLQRATADWVFLHENRYPILKYMFHTPNGGKRPKGEAGKLRAMGVRAGVYDWQLPFPSPYNPTHRGLAIELKSDVGSLTPDQRRWLTMAKENGYVTGVARNLEKFVSLVNLYLSQQPVAPSAVQHKQAKQPIYGNLHD